MRISTSNSTSEKLFIKPYNHMGPLVKITDTSTPIQRDSGRQLIEEVKQPH